MPKRAVRTTGEKRVYVELVGGRTEYVFSLPDFHLLFMIRNIQQ